MNNVFFMKKVLSDHIKQLKGFRRLKIKCLKVRRSKLIIRFKIIF
jgi:hypothetical protein